MIPQLLRYGTSSLGGLFFNLLLLSTLVEIAGVSEISAAVVSAGVTLLLTFALNEKWVFNRHQSYSRQLLVKRASIYYMIMILGKLINIGIHSILLWQNVWYPVAWIIGSGIIFVGTFILNRNLWARTGECQD